MMGLEVLAEKKKEGVCGTNRAAAGTGQPEEEGSVEPQQPEEEGTGEAQQQEEEEEEEEGSGKPRTEEADGPGGPELLR